MADLHLGKRQYNLEIRYHDYFNVFKRILEVALDRAVDFILISGDIFDNRKIDPSVLSEVFTIIQTFKNNCQEIMERDIPIICVEGNHDNPLSSSKSWISFLADLNLIILLSGNYDVSTKQINFPTFSDKVRRGGGIRIKDCYIYGIPFYGSFTPQLFPAIKTAINREPSTFNIMMMHFGIKGYDDSKPGIAYEEDLKHLHKKIDYLALGHYHRHYIHPKKEPWIFNPGSTEVNNMRELFAIKSEDPLSKNMWRSQRGVIFAEINGIERDQQNYELIEFDNGNNDGNIIPNRKFFSLDPINISQSNSFDEAIEFIIRKLEKLIPLKEEGNEMPDEDLNKMILIFSIRGEIPYSRIEININKLRQRILDTFDILEVRIYSKNLFSTLDYIDPSTEDKTINELEREIFISIIQENPKYNSKKEPMVELIEDIKMGLLLKRTNTQVIKDRIKNWSKLHYDEFKNVEVPSAIAISDTNLEDIDEEIENLQTETKSSNMEQELKISPQSIEDKKLQLYEDVELDLDDYIDDEDEGDKNKED